MLHTDWQVGQTGHVAEHNEIAQRLFNSSVVLGDGVTDNTTAIRNAIIALPAGRIFKARVILLGNIIISGTITVPDYTIIDNQGKVTLANGSNCNMFRVGNGATPGKNIEFVGSGEYDGNRANQSAGVGIMMWPVQDVLITGIYIHDCREQNIRALGACTRITVDSIRGVDGQAGNVYFLQSTAVSGAQAEITDSSILNSQLYYTTPIANVANVGLENCRRIKVTGNHLFGPADFGVHIEEHLYDSVIAINIIADHTQDGIRMGYSEGNTIAMNVTSKNGWRGISLSQGANQNTITMNAAQENGRSGILLEDCRDNLVADNTALNNNQNLNATYNAGIQILSVGLYAPLRNTIRGNICSDNQAVKTQQYGISDGGALSDFNIIEDNDVRGNALGPANNILRSAWVTTHSKVRRNLGSYNLLTFNAGDSTPSVAIGIELFETANTAPTTITMFDDGERGQTINVDIKDAFTTIDFSGTHLKGNGAVAWTPTNGAWMQCVFNGADWKCAVYDAT